jgi:hypothetical protein
MRKTTEERVKDAFDSGDFENAEKFFNLTVSSMRENSAAASRAIVIIFLLAGVFELLVASTTIKSLAIGPLSFSNTSLVQKFIPVLIAYLIYDAYILVNRHLNQLGICNAIIKRFQPKLDASELPLNVLPGLRGPWAFGARVESESNQEPGDEFIFTVEMIVLLIAFFVLPLAFESQAYYALMHKYGFHDVLVWISMAVSIFFIAAWLIKVSIEIRSTTSRG